jgi:hypothetical protein
VRLRPDDRSRVDLSATDGETEVSMGQSIARGRLTLAANVTHSSGRRIDWMRRGEMVKSSSVQGDDWTDTLTVDAVAGDWFSVIVRERTPLLISNPVYVQ